MEWYGIDIASQTGRFKFVVYSGQYRYLHENEASLIN